MVAVWSVCSECPSATEVRWPNRGGRALSDGSRDQPLTSIGTGAQHFDNVFGQRILDFVVAWNGLRDACLGVSIPVVVSSVTHQLAAVFSNFLDQRSSFHATAKSATLRIPGKAPLVRSAYRSRRWT